MEIQWFPGHMTRAKKLIQENRGKVDVFLELVDARAPQTCRNPLLGDLIGDRPRVVIMNKIDLADPQLTALWKKHFEAQPETAVVMVSSKERKNLPSISAACTELCRGKKWFGIRKIRGMIVGIPNVGKSTLLNALAGGHKASVAPQPGHTRGIQRIKVSEDFELLDTPGILWHKFDDPAVGERLAMLGSVKDDVVDFHSLTLKTIEFLLARYPSVLAGRYKVDGQGAEPVVVLERIARQRGWISKGAEPDWDRTCQAVMTDLRTGALGRISLERPPVVAKLTAAEAPTPAAEAT